MKNKIRFGIYRHAKGGLYMVMGSVKMKNPQTREWEDGVVYTLDNPPTLGESVTYVRTEADFRERFTEVRDSTDG